MDYIKKTYTDKAVEVQISSFAGKGGVTEYHVLLAITDVYKRQRYYRPDIAVFRTTSEHPMGLCGSYPRGVT